MINYYFDGRLLIVDLGVLYITVSNFSPWIAKNIEDYDYIHADWELINEKYLVGSYSKLLNNSDMFWSTVERNQPFFNRKIISTLLKKL